MRGFFDGGECAAFARNDEGFARLKESGRASHDAQLCDDEAVTKMGTRVVGTSGCLCARVRVGFPELLQSKFELSWLRRT
jgi:hypothetical protein